MGTLLCSRGHGVNAIDEQAQRTRRQGKPTVRNLKGHGNAPKSTKEAGMMDALERYGSQPPAEGVGRIQKRGEPPGLTFPGR